MFMFFINDFFLQNRLEAETKPNILALVRIITWHGPATSHCLNKCWLIYWWIYASPDLNELNFLCHHNVKKLYIMHIYIYVFHKWSLPAESVGSWNKAPLALVHIYAKIFDKILKYSWWRHQMETFSALRALFEGIHRSPVDCLTKASDAELLCFLWSVLEQTDEQTVDMPVIWDASTLIITSLSCLVCFFPFILLFSSYYTITFHLMQL